MGRAFGSGLRGRAMSARPGRPDPEGPTPISRTRRRALLNLGQREHQPRRSARWPWSSTASPRNGRNQRLTAGRHRHADTNAALRRLHGVLPAHEAVEIREEDVELPADLRDIGRH